MLHLQQWSDSLGCWPAVAGCSVSYHHLEGKGGGSEKEEETGGSKEKEEERSMIGRRG